MKSTSLWNGIRERAREKGMSLLELSIMSGVSYDMIKRYGNRYMPSAYALAKIAKALGTTSEELLKEEE